MMKQASFEHIVELNAPRQPDEPPVGKCIYCNAGRYEKKLTREHVIPDGLGGVLVIGEASCNDCAEKFKWFEQPVMKNHFGVARMAKGIRARDKRRNQRYKSQQNVKFFDRALAHQEVETILSCSNQEPIQGNLLDYLADMIIVEDYLTPPGILIGAGLQFEGTTRFRSIALPKNRHGPWSVTIKSEIGQLERLLAKIAHSFAAASIGLDGFKAYLPQFILSREPRMNRYLIGSMETSAVPGLHRLALYPMNVMVVSPPKLSATPKRVLVCDIHLFSYLNSVCYQVVVGEET